MMRIRWVIRRADTAMNWRRAPGSEPVSSRSRPRPPDIDQPDRAPKQSAGPAGAGAVAAAPPGGISFASAAAGSPARSSSTSSGKQQLHRSRSPSPASKARAKTAASGGSGAASAGGAPRSAPRETAASSAKQSAGGSGDAAAAAELAREESAESGIELTPEELAARELVKAHWDVKEKADKGQSGDFWARGAQSMPLAFVLVSSGLLLNSFVQRRPQRRLPGVGAVPGNPSSTPAFCPPDAHHSLTE